MKDNFQDSVNKVLEDFEDELNEVTHSVGSDNYLAEKEQVYTETAQQLTQLLKDYIEAQDLDFHYGCGRNDEAFITDQIDKDLCCGCYPHKSCEIPKALQQYKSNLLEGLE